MSTSPVPIRDLVPADENLPAELAHQLPGIVARAGKAAEFAADEFFFGRIRNEHTRRAYFTAVKRFLSWAEENGLELAQITPKFVGQYLDRLRKEKMSVATRKQHLAALRHFFDGMVTSSTPRYRFAANATKSWMANPRNHRQRRPRIIGFDQRIEPGRPPRQRRHCNFDLHRRPRRCGGLHPAWQSL